MRAVLHSGDKGMANIGVHKYGECILFHVYHAIYKFNIHIFNIVIYLLCSSIIHSDTALVLLLPCRVDTLLRSLMGVLRLQFKFLKHLLNDARNDSQANANSIQPEGNLKLLECERFYSLVIKGWQILESTYI